MSTERATFRYRRVALKFAALTFLIMASFRFFIVDLFFSLVSHFADRQSCVSCSAIDLQIGAFWRKKVGV